MMVNGMNGGGHAQMANWALSSVQIKENGQILDIGCGGGANIARLLQRAPKGVVQDIDYSSVSVAKSSKVNAKAIAEAKMLLHIRNDLSVQTIADMLGFGEQSTFSRYFKNETGMSPTEFRELD